MNSHTTYIINQPDLTISSAKTIYDRYATRFGAQALSRHDLDHLLYRQGIFTRRTLHNDSPNRREGYMITRYTQQNV